MINKFSSRSNLSTKSSLEDCLVDHIINYESFAPKCFNS